MGLGYLNLTVGENISPGDSTSQALAAVDLAGDSVWYSPASTPGPFNISRSGTVFLMNNYSINFMGGTTCEYLSTTYIRWP